ncbi:hypothetical protein HRbin09_00962 [bacterium HR09]|nr:hypothetical protein HRbin09_00962 [bacterium HR09]
MQEIPRFTRDDRRFAALGTTGRACHPKTRRPEGSAYRLDHLGNKPAQERGSHICSARCTFLFVGPPLLRRRGWARKASIRLCWCERWGLRGAKRAELWAERERPPA